MKLEIESYNRGYVVKYIEKENVEFVYIYKCTEEFLMLQEIAKKLLKLDVRVIEK